MEISNFLAEQLDKIAKSEGFLEYEIEHEAGSKVGDGFIAKMLAVTLSGKRKSANNEITTSKLHLMCKLLPENADRREAFDTLSMFEREIHIYNKVFVYFDQFQKEKNISIDDRFMEYPKCYLAASNNDEHVIIMENLKESGFALWDSSKPIDYESVCLYMKALGKLHALSFALRDQKPKIFGEITNIDDILIKILKKEGNPFKQMYTTTYEKALSLLGNSDEINVMKYAREHGLDEVIRLSHKANAGRFYVLLHGDSWNNNMFYSFEGTSKPNKICLLDWQLSKCGSPALDISCYLMTSTNKAVRQRYNDLIVVYYTSLSDFMEKLGSNSKDWFTFDDLVDQLKQVGVFGVLVAPILIQVLVSDPKNIVDMETMTKDSLRLTDVVSFDELASQNFKQRIGDVIQDAIRFGWIHFSYK